MRTNKRGFRVIQLGFDRCTYRIQVVVTTVWASLLGGIMYCPTLGTEWIMYHINVELSQKDFMTEIRNWMTDRETIAIPTVLLHTVPDFDVKYIDSSSQKKEWNAAWKKKTQAQTGE
jgi:hypothetical protein